MSSSHHVMTTVETNHNIPRVTGIPASDTTYHAITQTKTTRSTTTVAPSESNANVIVQYVPPFATWPANLSSLHHRVDVRLGGSGEGVETKKVKRVKKPKAVRRHSVHRTETVQEERMITDMVPIYEKVVEQGPRIRVDKEIEVAEIQIDEYELIHGEQKEVKERIIEVSKPVFVDKIVEVPASVPTIIEKIVEVPQIQYNDIPVEKIIEDVQIVEEEVIIEKRVPQYVEVPVPQTRVGESNSAEVTRIFPIPVEEEKVVQYDLDTIIPHHKKVKYQVFLPRFIEIPIATDLGNAYEQAMAKNLKTELDVVLQSQSLHNVDRLEQMAEKIHSADLVGTCQSKTINDLELLQKHMDLGRIDASELIMPSSERPTGGLPLLTGI